MAAPKFDVFVERDDEAGVWVATSDDIPGLVTEASTLDALMARVLAVAPELLQENAGHLSHRWRSGEAINIHWQSVLTLEHASAH